MKTPESLRVYAAIFFGFPLGLAIAVITSAFGYEVYLRLTSATVYTPGFSRTGFRQLRPGMTAAQVERILGVPFEKHEGSNGRVVWYYSRSDRNKNYEIVGVEFRTQDWRLAKSYRFYDD